MVSLIAAIIGLFVVFAIGPFLGRALVRLVHRVPALGAVATLGLFFAFTDAGSPEVVDASDAPSIFRADTSHSIGWSPDHPHQVTTTDEDMPNIYQDERMRYVEEIESMRRSVAEFLVS